MIKLGTKNGKQALLEFYKEQDLINPKALDDRETRFLKEQAMGNIDANLKYSDELFYDLIDSKYDVNIESIMDKNSYLTEIYNREALIDPKLMIGERNEIFQRGMQPAVMTGDTISIQYDQIGEIKGYDSTVFTPDKLLGGNLIFEQRAALNPTEGDKATDKLTFGTTVPIANIQQALQPKITQKGLFGAWEDWFTNIHKRSWEKFNFNRARQLISMAGGKPNVNAGSVAVWFHPDTTFTANEKQFVAVEKPTDESSLVNFMQEINTMVYELEGEYHTEYNPAGISDINKKSELGLYVNENIRALFDTTTTTLLNGSNANPSSHFKFVEFYNLLPSKVKKEATNVLAVLFVDREGQHPFRHYPMAQEGEGVRRYPQFWATNAVRQIQDHLYLNCMIDLSANIIIFYEKPKEN